MDGAMGMGVGHGDGSMPKTQWVCFVFLGGGEDLPFLVGFKTNRKESAIVFKRTCWFNGRFSC